MWVSPAGEDPKAGGVSGKGMGWPLGAAILLAANMDQGPQPYQEEVCHQSEDPGVLGEPSLASSLISM